MKDPHKTGVVEQLEAVRAALRAQEPVQRREMEEALDNLEQEFRVAEPPDPAALMTLLQAWEARLQAEHPVLSSVIADALQKLGAMGI